MTKEIDIVCRLRERAKWAAANGRTLVTIDCSDGATEIERLRTENTHLRKSLDEGHVFGDSAQRLHRRAGGEDREAERTPGRGGVLVTRRSLAAYALVIGMPSLTRANARLFYARAVFYERLFGPLLTYSGGHPRALQWEDVQRGGELRTGEFTVSGVEYEPTADWATRMFNLFRKEKT